MTPEHKKNVRALAEGEMYLAACAVSQQMRRLQSGEQPGPEYMADGRLFAESLRAAIRAGALCALLAEPNEASAIEAALNRLFESVPSSVDVRDVLEHFDDYLVGAGNLQKNRPTEFTQAYSRGPSQHEVIVGPLKLNVETADSAVIDLLNVVLIGEDHTEARE